MKYHTLYWEDVEAGQELPAITYELSLLRLVAFVRATGVYDYIHFDRDYAQSVGARDVFAATPHIAGLFSRLLTDWSGPDADIRSMSFSMRGQCCAGDVLTISGTVGKKYQNERGDYLVDVADMKISHPLASNAAVATATLALPSRVGGPVRIDTTQSPSPRVSPHPEMPEFARNLVGKRKDFTQRTRPITEDELHLWCECLEDWNPLYWDKQYAEASRYGRLIAPPMALLYGAGSSASLGVGCLKPGLPVPQAIQQGLTGMPLLQSLRQDMVAANAPISLPEFPEVVISDSRVEYFRPLHVGDLIHTSQQMIDCGPKKTTKLGEGYFLTWLDSSLNQHNEMVKTTRYTMFCYHT